ncbi:MAG TPA: NAD-dependent epimerase/dehydratase family protein [Gemmatimonadales bacterium]|nr:NAD-dependent epimerase/dehydratase family protein [Gemmatimonadales bacterium]
MTDSAASSAPTSSAARPLRVAVVGAGLISDLHIQGVRQLDVARLVAVVDADRERAAAKAAQYGIPGVYTALDAMLAAERPDVVHVLTPPATHADLCVAALEAGADVYVEKPMALTVADCDRMVEAAARTGRRLCVGHSLVFDPLMRQALAALRAGEIGDVVHAAAVYCFDPRRIPGYNSKGWYRRLGGGFVEDLAAHPASLLLRVLGDPTRITSATDPRPRHAESEITALLETARGAGTLFVSLDARPEDVRLELRGTRGRIAVNFTTMVVSVERERGLPKKLAHGVRNLAAAADHTVQTVTNTARFLTKRMDTTKGLHTLIGAFYAAIVRDRPAPVTPEEGREVVRLLRTLWPLASEAAAAEQPARRVLHRPAAWSEAPFGREPGATAPPTALVTGATGFIGRHLVRTLAERGVRVRALARTEERGRRLLDAHPGQLEVVLGDFGDPCAIEGLAEGADVVFHLASLMTGTHEEFARVDLAGGRRLIEEAARAGVRRVVFTSTMGAYALAELSDGAVVTEEMIDRPERVGPYSRAKLLLERDLMAAHRAGRFEAVVVRPGLVFGPGASPYLEHLPHLGSLKGDRYVVFGDGEVPLQLTYVENTVEALWLAATRPEAAGGTFTIIDDALPTQREFVARLAGLTGRPLAVRAIPRAGAWVIGAGVETLCRALGKSPPTTRRLLLGKTTKLRFDCSRAKEVLGWRPAVGWEEGLRRAVEAAG